KDRHASGAGHGQAGRAQSAGQVDTARRSRRCGGLAMPAWRGGYQWPGYPCGWRGSHGGLGLAIIKGEQECKQQYIAWLAIKALAQATRPGISFGKFLETAKSLPLL